VGFTLIEMMVVVGIIFVLAGLLLPAVLKAVDYAKRATVRERINELETAWLAYMTDYRGFPDLPIDRMNPDAVRLLTTNPVVRGGSVVNYLKAGYMDFIEKQHQHGLLDYWGERTAFKSGWTVIQTNRWFQIALDNGKLPHDRTPAYDGCVTPYAPTDTSIVTKTVAVW